MRMITQNVIRKQIAVRGNQSSYKSLRITESDAYLLTMLLLYSNNNKQHCIATGAKCLSCDIASWGISTGKCRKFYVDN